MTRTKLLVATASLAVLVLMGPLAAQSRPAARPAAETPERWTVPGPRTGGWMGAPRMAAHHPTGPGTGAPRRTRAWTLALPFSAPPRRLDRRCSTR